MSKPVCRTQPLWICFLLIGGAVSRVDSLPGQILVSSLLTELTESGEDLTFGQRDDLHLAQRDIMLRRRSRSSWVRGIMNERPT